MDGSDLGDETQEELAHLHEKTGSIFKRKILLWAVRWAGGFALIGLLDAYFGDLEWLWWAGSLLAALSLATTLLVYFFMSKTLSGFQDGFETLHDDDDEEDDGEPAKYEDAHQLH